MKNHKGVSAVVGAAGEDPARIFPGCCFLLHNRALFQYVCTPCGCIIHGQVTSIVLIMCDCNCMVHVCAVSVEVSLTTALSRHFSFGARHWHCG